MINEEKLIRNLKDKIKNGIYYVDVQNLINELESGYYDSKNFHDVNEFYPDDEDVWCK